MAPTKGRVIREYAVTVTHDDRHVIVSWHDPETPGGRVQYRALQDGWTSEASAVREAATMLLDTDGCWVEVVQNPLHHDGTKWTKGAGHYSMRLRVKD